MAGFVDRIGATIAKWHATRVHGRFRETLHDVIPAQQRALERALLLVRSSAFGKRWGLDRVRTIRDLRDAVPLHTYEDLRPTIDRVCDGDVGALFRPRQRLLMFATSSGTTNQPKRIPVTPAFARDYRRGWNVFGLKLLSDHPDAMMRFILQSSSRYDAARTRSGIPVGAITGLLARTQKRIVRRFYVGRPEIAHLATSEARYYALMRLAVERDVSFAITANPATLIQLARTADEHADTLLRDVRDGTIDAGIIDDAAIRRLLLAGLRPNPARAGALERLRTRHGQLRPRDYWDLSFVACWTGGSMGHYLRRLADGWGPIPVRDIGLLASEGRVTIPLADNTPAGVLDCSAAFFEFIPARDAEAVQPATLLATELAEGEDYAVVLTNTTGLVRYRLDDVVRTTGRVGQAPVLEFLHRAGRVSSVAGEKLTEHQVVRAVASACRTLGLPEIDFMLGPVWGDPPHYRLTVPRHVESALAAAVDAAIASENGEYAERRSSKRLGMVVVRVTTPGRFTAMDAALQRARSSFAEQYKRPSLALEPGDDDRLLGLTPSEGG